MQEMEETWVRSLGREDPLEKEMATTLIGLPGESHGQRSLTGYGPWGRKESDMHISQIYLPASVVESCDLGDGRDFRNHSQKP